MEKTERFKLKLPRIAKTENADDRDGGGGGSRDEGGRMVGCQVAAVAALTEAGVLTVTMVILEERVTVGTMMMKMVAMATVILRMVMVVVVTP